VFDHISKHLEVHQTYSTTWRLFNFLLGVKKCRKHGPVRQKYPGISFILNSFPSVWECGQTQPFVFDVSLNRFFKQRQHVVPGISVVWLFFFFYTFHDFVHTYCGVCYQQYYFCITAVTLANKGLTWILFNVNHFY